MSQAKISDKKEIYVLRTHLWNDSIDVLYRQLQEDLGIKHVWILVDITHGIPVGLPKDTHRIIRSTETQLKEYNPLHVSSYYSAETAFLWFDEWVSDEYDFVWFIEYDVRCPSNWKLTLDKSVCHKPLADLAAVNPSMSDDDIRKEIDTLKRYGFTRIGSTLFAVTRFSRVFLQFFRDHYFKRVGVYCEVLLPSVLHQHSQFECVDFDKSVIKTHYKYRPQLSFKEYKELIQQTPSDQHHQLIHPVVCKPESELISINPLLCFSAFALGFVYGFLYTRN